MRANAIAIALLAIGGAGCTEPHPTAFDATFDLSACRNSQTTPAPCVFYGTASHSDQADSGRLVLTADQFFEMTVWITITRNQCYLQGKYCPTTEHAVDTARGSYQVADDVLTLSITSRAWQLKTPFHELVLPGPGSENSALPLHIDVIDRNSFSYLRFTRD